MLNADNLCSHDWHPAGIGDIVLLSNESTRLTSDISIDRCRLASIKPHHSPQ